MYFVLHFCFMITINPKAEFSHFLMYFCESFAIANLAYWHTVVKEQANEKLKTEPFPRKLSTQIFPF